MIKKKIILFVGRPDYSKGFDIFLELTGHNKDIQFISVTFPKNKIKKQNLISFEAVQNKNLVDFYNAADILIFPSRFEGFGYVPLEALSCNTKVISNKVGIINELKNQKIKNLEIVKNNSATEYNKIVNELLRRKQSNSYKFIKKNYSSTNFKNKYLKLVKEILYRK